MTTDNIGLGAALATRHIHPTKTFKSGNRVFWEFDDSTEVAELCQSYLTGRLQGSLLAFNAALMMFQSQLRGGR